MEDRKSPRRRIAPHHLTVRIERQTRDLKLEVVLIGPEPRNLRRRSGPTDNGRRRLLGLFQRIGHALQPVRDPAVHGNRPPRHVADGEDGRIAGPRLIVHHHPVVATQARRPRQAVAGQGAHADQNRIRLHHRPVGQGHAVMGDRDHLGAGDDLHPPRPVLGREEGRQGLGRHPRQHARRPFDHHRLGAQGPGRGRRLQSHIAAADNSQSPARPQDGLQPLGVLQRPQLQQVGMVPARNRQFARRRSRRQHQDVIGLARPVVEGDRLRLRVHRHGDRRRPKLDPLLLIEAQRPQQQRLQIRLPLQPGLGQGRPLIRRRILLADQHKGAFMPVLPQKGRDGAAGVACADDQDLGHVDADSATHGFCLLPASQGGGELPLDRSTVTA